MAQDPGSTAGRPRRLILIVNPAAGRHSGFFRQVREALDDRGCQVEIRATSGPGDGETIAGEITANDCDALVVAGGDGTINDAVNGLTHDSPPLGIVPLGTANVFAAEIGLPIKPDIVAATLAGGTERGVWLGAVDGRRFVQMAGIGFDAAVVEAVDLAFKRRVGKLAYALQSLRLLRRYDFPRFVLDIDGEAEMVASAIIANGRFYGGRYVCAPTASLYEPSFEICLFDQSGPGAAMSYGAALLAGQLHRHPRVRIIRGRKISVTQPSGAPIQVDGDIASRIPTVVEAGVMQIAVLHPPQ